MNLIDKYLPPQEKINYLSKFLLSFAKTSIERYGKVDLENLYYYQAPIYFEEPEKSPNIEKTMQELTKIKSFLPTHLIIKMDKTNEAIVNHYCFLKMNKSLFLVENNTDLNIKVLFPFYTEKIDLVYYQEDFNLLIDKLGQDFKF